eukprot:2472752-Prymnesium_polylepis.1
MQVAIPGRCLSMKAPRRTALWLAMERNPKFHSTSLRWTRQWHCWPIDSQRVRRVVQGLRVWVVWSAEKAAQTGSEPSRRFASPHPELHGLRTIA